MRHTWSAHRFKGTCLVLSRGNQLRSMTMRASPSDPTCLTSCLNVSCCGSVWPATKRNWMKVRKEL